MSHPSISADVVKEHLDDLRAGKVLDLASLAKQVGDGPPIDLGGLDETAAEILGDLDEHRAEQSGLDDDQFEGACRIECGMNDIVDLVK